MDNDEMMKRLADEIVSRIRQEKSPEYITINELTRELRVSESTIRRMVRSGKIPSTLVGRSRRFSLQDVRAALGQA